MKKLILPILLLLLLVVLFYFMRPVVKTQKIKIVNILRSNRPIVPVQAGPEEIVIFEPEDIDYYEPPLDTIVVDTQNVHDSYIVKSTAKASENLRDSGLTGRPFDQWLAEGGLQGIVDRMKERNANVISIGKTEYQVVLEVYESVKGDSLLEEELRFQLKDCIENEVLVCATGVVTRVLSVHLVKNPENPLLTESMIREILLSRCYVLSKETDCIYEKLLEEYPQYTEVINKLGLQEMSMELQTM